jgi:hypothetical protein
MNERSAAEERLAARGVPIGEDDFPSPPVDPEHEGCALIGEREGGIIVNLTVRTGLDGERRAGFAEWAESRIDRFLEHGPEPDGWQKRSDGDWQLWVRRVYLGDLDDPDL